MTTEEKDDFLKNITVDWMINQVQSGEATPSLVNCIRQYLKDNGVHSSIKHDNQNSAMFVLGQCPTVSNDTRLF